MQNLDEVIFEVTKFDICIMILIFFAIISVCSMCMVYTDKLFATQDKSRIPEKSLFTTAIFGGALAMFFTMKKIRHKTQHKRFMIGLPIIFTIQAGLIAWGIWEWLL